MRESWCQECGATATSLLPECIALYYPDKSRALPLGYTPIKRVDYGSTQAILIKEKVD